MAAPRSAAAAVATTTTSSRNASATTSFLDGKGSKRTCSRRKEKIKVDWKDVEAKAKREAMWLLQWRKQQEAHAEVIRSRESPKKRRRSAVNDSTLPSYESMHATSADAFATTSNPEDMTNKDDAARERQPANALEISPASPKPDTYRVVVVTPPEPWLSSVAATAVTCPAGAVKRDREETASRAPVCEHHVRLESYETTVDSALGCVRQPTESVARLLNKEVVPSAATVDVVGAVGPGHASEAPWQPQSEARSTAIAAVAENCSTLQPGRGEEFSDVEMEKSSPGGTDTPVSAQCMPIPTEDYVMWPRLPMPEPGPKGEACWTSTYGVDVRPVAQNPRPFWPNGVFDNSGPGFSTFGPETAFLPPLLPSTSVQVTVETVEMPPAPKERPVQDHASPRTALGGLSPSLSPSPTPSPWLQEDNGISLLAAAAADRVIEEAHQQPGQFEASSMFSPVDPEGEEGNSALAAGSSTLLSGGNRHHEEERMAGQVELSAASLAGIAASESEKKIKTTGVGARESILPWRPRELHLIVRGKANAGAVRERARACEDRVPSGALPNRKGERTPDALWKGAHLLPCSVKFSAASTVARKEIRRSDSERKTKVDPHGSIADNAADLGQKTKKPFGCRRAVHGRGLCPVAAAVAPRNSPGCFGSPLRNAERHGLRLFPDASHPAAAPPSSLKNGAASGENRGKPEPHCLRYLPADGLQALQAAGVWDGTVAATATTATATAATATATAASPDRNFACWNSFESGVPGQVVENIEQAARVFEATGAPVMWGYDGYYDGAMDKKRKAARRRRKRPRRKRETHVLVSESDGEEEPGTSTSMWAGVEEKAKAEAKALLSYRNSGMLEAEANDNQHWVRRSVRAAGTSALEYPHVAKLLEQIRLNDPEVEVLKLHHYLGPDVNTAVINAVLDALSMNTNCQALYIQNFNDGFRDEQVAALAKVLRKGNIWCLNAGESYNVSLSNWWEFVEDIKATNVTHAYLSEHVITPELKIAMRTAIRDNRAKHSRHKIASNLDVIRRCTNMWWNPINSKELQAELKRIDAASFGIIGAGIVVPAAERVPCSLHGRPDVRLDSPDRTDCPLPFKRPDSPDRADCPLPIKRPDSPDRTDCPLRPRGPCVFLDGVIH